MSTTTMYINNTIIQLSIIDYSLNREGWAINILGILRDKTMNENLCTTPIIINNITTFVVLDDFYL